MKDYDKFKFNTAIAKLMEGLNEVDKYKLSKEVLGWFVDNFIRLLAPIAPHLSEELFHEFSMDEMYGKKSVFQTPLPQPLKGLKKESVEIGVQINGRFRGRITVPFNASEDKVLEVVKGDERLRRYISKGIKKVIYVPNKIINIITV